ncbi:probable G-protein coupled receptor 34 isoform X2 [Electrophorus electricus]|uniref:probable G-protein coupled receptor 34 isoform X2 n=1 Tax=Electrophorus electricus TaxID=8005 RepID=UPI0015CFE217|nr:probable G-protein coupled receptor 34 isoform X2 [Electrophorus electricus]
MALEPNSTRHHNCSMDDNSLRVLLAVSYSLIFLLGLVGNVLALWVFLRLHTKKNSVWIFLVNLAMADLLLVICLPLRVAYHVNHEHWAFPSVLCKFVGNAFYTNMYISIVLLGLISVDRYLKLQKVSKKQRFLSSRQSKVTCCLLWVLAIGVMVTLIVFAKDQAEPNKCFHYRRLINNKWKGYFNLALMVDVSCQWVKVVNKGNEIALLLSALNSCLDPVIYFLLCGSVRKVIVRMLRDTFCLEALAGFSSSSNEMGRNQHDPLTESQSSTLRRGGAIHVNSP